VKRWIFLEDASWNLSDVANQNCKSTKEYVYRIWKVEGRCTQLTSSSLHTYIIIGWHKSIVSSDWSDTMVWFGQILLYLTFHILYTWSLSRRDVKSAMWTSALKARRRLYRIFVIAGRSCFVPGECSERVQCWNV